MEIEIKESNEYDKTKIIIYTNKINDNITNIVDSINKLSNNKIKGYKNDKLYLINVDNIESFYSENGKNYFKTDSDTYIIKSRLYELEELLDKNKFVRISKSEIVNFNKVKNIDFKVFGTLILNFKSGNRTFVSRRYISKIKEFLNI